MSIQRAAAAAITAILLSSQAWGALVYGGTSFSGGLTSSWSNENGSPVYAPIDPIGWTVSLSSGGLSNRLPVSGTLTAYAPAAGGGIEGKLFHVQAVLGTPLTSQFGMGIDASLSGQIYLSGASSSTLYYAMSFDEVTTPDGVNISSHSDRVWLAGAFDHSTTLANDHFQSFGTTIIRSWQGGDLLPTQDGSGFVNFNAAVGSMNSDGPGQEITLDFWLTFSESPITTMPSAVPEPETWSLMLAGLGLLGWVGRHRKQQVA